MDEKRLTDKSKSHEECYGDDILLTKNKNSKNKDSVIKDYENSPEKDSKDIKIKERALAELYDADEKADMNKIHPVLDGSVLYTYEDYCTWDDEIRYELIDGIPYIISAPLRVHQSIGGSLFYQLYGYLKDKPCKVYYAPFDVRLYSENQEKEHLLNNQDDVHFDTVVQPDILVICDKSKFDDRGCIGAPDLVIEILSKSTARYDRVIKFNKYLQSGIREYWIIDPESKVVTVNILDNEKYYSTSYEETDTVPVFVLDGFRIDLEDVFGDLK